MSDEQAATAPEVPAVTPEVSRNEEPKDAPLGEAGEKALEAFKQRAKEAEKAAKEATARLQEIEDRDKSELDKTRGKLTKAEQAAAEAQAKLLRYEVASDLEVPAKLVPLLTATDREGLEAQAKLILENAKPATPDFDGGTREPVTEPLSPEEEHNKLFLQALGILPN